MNKQKTIHAVICLICEESEVVEQIIAKGMNKLFSLTDSFYSYNEMTNGCNDIVVSLALDYSGDYTSLLKLANYFARKLDISQGTISATSTDRFLGIYYPSDNRFLKGSYKELS